jgi:hypothetical protein
MTQYTANPQAKTKKEPAPKKGTIVTFRKPNSPHLFFMVVGGGTIPKELSGAWISQKDADTGQARYEASKRKPKKGDPAMQESATIKPVGELQAASA